MDILSRRGSQIAIWLMILSLGVIIGVALLSYYFYQKAVSDLVIERDRQLAFLSAMRLKEEFAKFADELTNLSRLGEIYQGDPATRQATLEASAMRLKAFDGGVILLNEQGRVSGSLPMRSELQGQDWSAYPFFSELLLYPQPFYSDAIQLTSSDPYYVVISIPILGQRGEFTGALAGFFSLYQSNISSFYASIIRLRIGSSGNTYLVDSQGQLLYDSAASVFDESLLNKRLSYLNLESQAGALRTQDEQGNPVVVAHAQIPGTRWILVTEDDWGIMLSSISRYSNILLILLAAGILVPSIGIIILLRRQAVLRQQDELAFQELVVNQQIQQRLLPRQAPILPGWNIDFIHQPARVHGGDFYDFLFMPDGCLVIVLATVNDSGLNAAITISSLRTAFRSAARSGQSPPEVLMRCNQLLCPELQPGVSVSALFAILDPGCAELHYAAARMPAPLRYNGQVSLVEPAANSQAIGAQLNLQFQENFLSLPPGESLLLYTTGILETINREGEMFGLERLRTSLSTSPGENQTHLEKLSGDLSDFVGRPPTWINDVTLITIEHRGTIPSG